MRRRSRSPAEPVQLSRPKPARSTHHAVPKKSRRYPTGLRGPHPQPAHKSRLPRPAEHTPSAARQRRTAARRPTLSQAESTSSIPPHPFASLSRRKSPLRACVSPRTRRLAFHLRRGHRRRRWPHRHMPPRDGPCPPRLSVRCDQRRPAGPSDRRLRSAVVLEAADTRPALPALPARTGPADRCPRRPASRDGSRVKSQIGHALADCHPSPVTARSPSVGGPVRVVLLLVGGPDHAGRLLGLRPGLQSAAAGTVQAGEGGKPFRVLRCAQPCRRFGRMALSSSSGFWHRSWGAGTEGNQADRRLKRLSSGNGPKFTLQAGQCMPR